MIFDPLKGLLVAWLTEGIKEIYNFLVAWTKARFPQFPLPPLGDMGSLVAQFVINAVLQIANSMAAQLPVTLQNVLMAVVAWIVASFATAAAYRIVVKPLVKIGAAAQAYLAEKTAAAKEFQKKVSR